MQAVYSNNIPISPLIEKGLLYLRWDIKEEEEASPTNEVPQEDGSASHYTYKEAVVKAVVDRDYLIRSVVASQYSIEDELAIINNYANNPEKYAERWVEYQQFREDVKVMVDGAVEMIRQQRTMI